MLKKIIPLMVVIGLLMSLTGCEALFTRSLFSNFAADPSEMSPAQLEKYAEGVLGTGDTASMADAFNALSATLPIDAADDPELYLLAVDLAMGGSGLTDVVFDALGMLTSAEVPEDPAAVYAETMETLDTVMLEESVTLFAAVVAVPGAEISQSQYANAAAAQLVVLLAEADGDPGALNEADSRYDLALEWAELGGIDIAGFL